MDILVETHSKAYYDENGDYILHQSLSNGDKLILLADGVGSLDYPELASNIVCNAINEYVSLNINNDIDVVRLLGASIEYADTHLANTSKELGSKMGVALTLIYIQRGVLFYSWLGDVRLYLQEGDGEITQLTKDDVLEQDGQTYLTSHISGRGFRNPVSIKQYPLSSGDILLLCSDGFYRSHRIEESFTATELTLDAPIYDDSSVIRISIR
ncbi:PP2C family protein-serine/threonine phosphatase [Porphyromonas levii]|uniref:PP2C family protein-serine/threonine phosphatase n=1 Tax=Porphyromonas levii TaxID=28114 RepID=UPI001BACEA8A|nr:protein phosphatase 2C domain-containing protein [Porphyromonas levii]MBR8703323.1 hypothetical protein [Porphyromonas levii]MBR8766589.1 hypothetical protein [Porphyromonas levii]MBR8803606.1 hypothetical protein [Porphyromonas levii]